MKRTEGGREEERKEGEKEGREGRREEGWTSTGENTVTSKSPSMLLPGNRPPGASSDHLLAFFLEMFQARTAPMKA